MQRTAVAGCRGGCHPGRRVARERGYARLGWGAADLWERFLDSGGVWRHSHRQSDSQVRLAQGAFNRSHFTMSCFVLRPAPRRDDTRLPPPVQSRPCYTPPPRRRRLLLLPPPIQRQQHARATIVCGARDFALACWLSLVPQPPTRGLRHPLRPRRRCCLSSSVRPPARIYLSRRASTLCSPSSEAQTRRVPTPWR